MCCIFSYLTIYDPSMSMCVCVCVDMWFVCTFQYSSCIFILSALKKEELECLGYVQLIFVNQQ